MTWSSPRTKKIVGWSNKNIWRYKRGVQVIHGEGFNELILLELACRLRLHKVTQLLFFTSHYSGNMVLGKECCFFLSEREDIRDIVTCGRLKILIEMFVSSLTHHTYTLSLLIAIEILKGKYYDQIRLFITFKPKSLSRKVIRPIHVAIKNVNCSNNTNRTQIHGIDHIWSWNYHKWS